MREHVISKTTIPCVRIGMGLPCTNVPVVALNLRLAADRRLRVATKARLDDVAERELVRTVLAGVGAFLLGAVAVAWVVVGLLSVWFFASIRAPTVMVVFLLLATGLPPLGGFIGWLVSRRLPPS